MLPVRVRIAGRAAVAMIFDCRGRILLYQDPAFDIEVQERIELTARLKQEAQGR
ncbi:hypothetical protein [Streptomyces fulvoviolaceus]|uniref:hypothetical protein n=1 Tax=Streptomyces fulvoviolaceus TaxID=285535 RepID=UPI0021BE45D9|nr:hypothetical protein [Streptomyces fulvoviolaceus]MCT9081448.1 hypothetical protein [Streptomyces fulvoviolaceus]